MSKTRRVRKILPPNPGSPAPWSAGLIDPIDYMILAELPVEGGKLGYHPIGTPARVLADKLEVPSSTVAGRLGTLHKLELVTAVRIMPVARGRGWQITPAGQKVLRSWQKSKTPTKGSTT